MAKAGALLLSLRFLAVAVVSVINAHVNWDLLTTSPLRFVVDGIDWILFLTSPTFLALVAIGLYVVVDQIVEDIHILKEYNESESDDIEVERPLYVLLTGIVILFITAIYKSFSVLIINDRAVFTMQFDEFFTAVFMDLFYLGLVFFGLGLIAQSLTVYLRSSGVESE